jgi:hypothetical protein
MPAARNMRRVLKAVVSVMKDAERSDGILAIETDREPCINCGSSSKISGVEPESEL